MAALLALGSLAGYAQYSFSVYGDFKPYVGSNDFAPYYMSALQADRVTQSKGLLIGLGARDSLSLRKRFDLAWGIEAIGGPSSTVDYQMWDNDAKAYRDIARRPAPVRLQQLYAEVKWRCLLLSVGMKTRGRHCSMTR